MDDADELVEVGRGHRESGVAGRVHGSSDLVTRQRQAYRHDVQSGGHDLAHSPVREVEQRIDDLALGLLDLTSALPEGREGSDVGLRWPSVGTVDRNAHDPEDAPSDAGEE